MDLDRGSAGARLSGPGGLVRSGLLTGKLALTAQVFTEWCEQQGLARHYIQPGKPDQNAFIERFNRTYREEVLDAYVFASIREVQRLTDDWLTTYNDYRPHDSLGRIPPTRFLPRPPTPPSSYAVCP